jgi:uncharacterized membrane protein YuzA (DUF378 family)
MKTVNILTLVLLIVGGINWGLVGLFQFDLVAAIFGDAAAPLARIVYVLVGLSALWQSIPQARAAQVGEVHAQSARHQQQQLRGRRLVRTRIVDGQLGAVLLDDLVSLDQDVPGDAGLERLARRFGR